MKKMLKKVLALTVVMTTLLSNAMFVSAAEPTEDKEGDGEYAIIVTNTPGTTNIKIEDDWFHAYQIFHTDSVTSYSVHEDFKGFFFGTMTGGDGSSTSYDFDQYLTIINAYPSIVDPTSLETAAYETAVHDYNLLAGKYIDSYTNNMYTLATQIRAYLDENGHYNGVVGGIECTAHAKAQSSTVDEVTTETATLAGLEKGYYFIFDQASTANGIGIAASGAFMPITSRSEVNTYLPVKANVPTMEKTIYHDDETKWDTVGDSQIGDEVPFRIISTLPNNIGDYVYDETENPNAIDKYDYIITDTMSEGLTYNADPGVKVYLDAEKQNDVTSYASIETTETGFKMTVNVIELLADNPNVTTLYTFYSATLNEKAVVANEFDKNTAKLEYSTNPSDETDKGETESTVIHYTFALDVNKVDENGAGLAGARFGIFDENGKAIPLAKGDTDANGVVRYHYDETVPVIEDGGYITTEKVTLEDSTEVTGKFEIYGLNDKTAYTLREVEAPEGYTPSAPFDFNFTVEYTQSGYTISHFTDGSAYVNTKQDNAGNWYSESTIINRLKIYLPDTGGMGTVAFQVGGGLLMLGAVVVLLNSQRKKEHQ